LEIGVIDINIRAESKPCFRNDRIVQKIDITIPIQVGDRLAAPANMQAINCKIRVVLNGFAADFPT